LIVLAAGQAERAQQVGEVVLVAGVAGDHHGGSGALVAAERGEFEGLGFEGLAHVGEHDRSSYAAVLRGLRWAMSSGSRLRFRWASVSGRAFAPWRCHSGEAGGSG
jgi:hypothetical protein